MRYKRQMSCRILVLCKTAEMPGAHNEKVPFMIDRACQSVWNRNLSSAERVTSLGGYCSRRCTILIDHGPVDSEAFKLVQLIWRDGKL